MNHLEGQRGPAYDYIDSYQTSTRIQQIISTVAILVLGYYLISLFDAWPSTTKRTLYELVLRLIPSRFIYALQHAMMRFGRLPQETLLFRREDFGNIKAKEEALQRMLGDTSIPNVLQRARTLSGYDRLLPSPKELGPPGLGNWDNSCYQNSVLQGLASLPAFQHYVHRSLQLCEKNKTSGPTTSALYVFLDQLSDATGRKQTIWTPKVLKSMDSWQQQDAQEYFSRILEAVEKEATQYVKVLNKTTSLSMSLRTDTLFSQSAKQESVRKFFQTLVDNPMDGMFAQALTCQTCGFSEGVSLTQFNCLTLNLGLGGQRSIETLLDEFTEPELIEGVECDNCTRLANQESRTRNDSDEEDGEGTEIKTTSSTKKVKKELRVKAKQITFGRLPNDLVMHVNRSIWDDYGNQIKNPSFVQFPSKLDFSGRWCAPLDAASDTIHATYELKCIVTHSGRHDNGHYVAYGMRDKEWYCFNDDIVTKLSEQQVLSRGNVFMLFYEATDRSELMALGDGEAGAVDEEIDIIDESVVEDDASPSSSGAESEPYEDSISNPPRIPIPAMRTAGGSIQLTGSDASFGPTFVPAV